MNVTFIRGTALGGVGNDANPGDVRNLPDQQANDLIRKGRAVAGGTMKKTNAKAEKPAAESTPSGAEKDNEAA